MSHCMITRARCAGLLWMLILAGGVEGAEAELRSPRVRDVLREPLAAETLNCSESANGLLVQGPTFQYEVGRSDGMIASMKAVRDGEVVVRLDGPAVIAIDDLSPVTQEDAKLRIVRSDAGQTLIEARVRWSDPNDAQRSVDGVVQHLFYSDGVVVTRVELAPGNDFLVRSSIRCKLKVCGKLTHFLHKDSTRYDSGGTQGTLRLPAPGQSVLFRGATSCLEAFSRRAAVALFTDLGGLRVSPDNLDTAAVNVTRKEGGDVFATLEQYVIRIAPGSEGHRLAGKQPFTFRTGIAVAPNRPPHRRSQDLRMFVWIGDEKHPYPSAEEIDRVAQLGFTVFQMHRLGHPGEPRPPAGELDRVLRQVHAHGMLFLWTQNNDLMYSQAGRVQELTTQGKFSQWQGTWYGGRYRASMDPYCDLLATCIASPNGLAEYRLESDSRMMDRYSVDGMYIDDNISLAGCKLTSEHGHPRDGYDCLIEMHDMNWRRRQLLHGRCPHALLVGHCGPGLSLPVICDFDVQLYGEGRSFGSLDNFWELFGSVQKINSQGCIWPGDSEDDRSETGASYALDMLTGGGKYCYIDWRLFPSKFPYAKGVSDREAPLVEKFNLAQFYFGLYESDSHYFSDSPPAVITPSPDFRATAYRNRAWNDVLIAVANLAATDGVTTLQVPQLDRLGLRADESCALVHVGSNHARILSAAELTSGIGNIAVPRSSCHLVLLRACGSTPRHIWGGKRITERWDDSSRTLAVELDGPKGVEQQVVLSTAGLAVEQVRMGDASSVPPQSAGRGLIRIGVRFGSEPVSVKVTFGEAVPAPPQVQYRWEQVTGAAPFAPRDGAGGVVFAGKMWLLGGWNPADKAAFPLICNSEVWQSTDGASWLRLPDAPWEGRHTAGYVVHDGKMWVVGGDAIQKHYQNDVWNSTDGVTWSRVTDRVPWGPRVLQYTVAHANGIWVMGGQTLPQFVQGDERFFNDVWKTTDGVEWTRVIEHAPWTPRGMVGGAAVFHDRIWLIGGGTYDTPQHPRRQFFGEVWSSADAVEWTCHNDRVPWHPRQYHETAVFDNRLWVLEGWNGANRNDVWYSADGETWDQLRDTPWAARHAATVFVHEGALWLVAGNHFGRDVWKLVRAAP